MHKAVIILILFVFPLGGKSALPGTFYWKPRMGLTVGKKPTEPQRTIYQPNRKNIEQELTILIDGYHFGTTILALIASYFAITKPFLHLKPWSGYFHTNAYRWILRHLILIPQWLGTGGKYIETHKVWNRRFYFMDEFVPKWMRKVFFWVKEEEWQQEEDEFKIFLKWAEPAFGKHYMYPTKKFNNFHSQRTTETVENLESD
ncbi:uncharacterized protein LOC126380245 [Pectinophora gossypiella]|uniref:uncharacterized protein LOC126380245 n=1 Tax=Pectinophora gossypiella TaxID=13191 RepID=UPI00214EE802|nr:uncharacterized protein LOC126380245 [Pectinophora gossypiella]